jgi:ABC-type amino acid transport substrate-binding protein
MAAGSGARGGAVSRALALVLTSGLALTLGLVPAPGLAASPAAAPPAVAAPAAAAPLELGRPGTLRVVAVGGSPAFFNLKSGEPGLDREVLEGFARLHGLTVSPVEAPSWSALVSWLVEGRGDVVAGGVTATPARRQKIDFTSEVMPTRLVIVSRRPTGLLDTIEQLRGEKVGTVRGSSMAEALQAAGIAADDSIPTGGTLEALRSGRITAALIGIEDALLYRRADEAVQVGGFVGAPASLAFGVRKDAPRLEQALDEYVTNLRRTPTWSRLLVKYFGSSAPGLLKRARADNP